MKQRIRFNTLINQKDTCIIVSFAKKYHEQRIHQPCIPFYVTKSLLPFMSPCPFVFTAV